MRASRAPLGPARTCRGAPVRRIPPLQPTLYTLVNWTARVSGQLAPPVKLEEAAVIVFSKWGEVSVPDPKSVETA